MINWKENSWKAGAWRNTTWKQRVVAIVSKIGRNIAARLPNWMFSTSGPHFK